MKLKIIVLLLLLISFTALEAGLRYSDWKERNLVERWGRFTNTPTIEALFPIEKSKDDIRIGIFGGLNVMGFTLAPDKKLAHFMKINPPQVCELQGRNCEFRAYGRISAPAKETAQLIQEKMKEDQLDIAIWLVDPRSELSPPPNLPWTSSLALNWMLSPFSKKNLQKNLSSQLEVLPDLTSAVQTLREDIFKNQKDLIPVVMIGMDVPLEKQKEWEKDTSAAFFNHGFLPLRAKIMINEKTRGSLALYGTSLMNEESLRSLASIVRDRVNRSPQMKAHSQK